MRCALLHGFAGTPAAWNDVVTAWQLDEPPRAIPLPGHGGSAVLDSWNANIDSVARAIGDVDVVIGYSLGARVALGLVAAKHISRAILISVNPGIADSERAARRASDAAWARMLREQGIAAFEAAWTAQPLFATQARVDSTRLASRRAARLALDPEQLARSLETMGLAEMPDYRGALGASTALIVGADDAKYVALAQPYGADIVPDSGHDITLEQPERLAAAIARAVGRLA